MKKVIILITIILLIIPLKVKANIICNDGTVSPSCSVCSQGCCSHHGGCLSSKSRSQTKRKSKTSVNNDYSNSSNKLVTNNDFSNQQDNVSDSTAIWVTLTIGAPIIIVIIASFNEKNNKE